MSGFCSRKGGSTVKGKFHAHPHTSEILARQIKNYSIKLEGREAKRQEKASRKLGTPSKKDQSALRGRQFLELFFNGKIYSRSRRTKKFTLNPIAAAKRLLS